jgi:hypothetical protein
VDETEDHHVKWNKPGSERQTLNIFWYAIATSKGKIYIKVTVVVLEGEVSGKWEYLRG